MASPISFQGISTGLQTDALINAILKQEGQPLQRLQDRLSLNNKRVAALQSLVTNLKSLSTSLSTLQNTSFDARTVSSSDSTNAYVTATATGTSAGTYDVKVTTIATKAQLTNTGGADTSFKVANATTTSIFSGASAKFAVQGTNGTVKVITLSSSQNSLTGLKDAINASGAGVEASIVNLGTGSDPYQLVLTSTSTGTGSTSGAVKLADITNATDGGPAGAAVNTIGIDAGYVNSEASPTSITGGDSSSGSQVGVDATFTVNGVSLTRSTNTVTDAVDGMTFQLVKGGQSTATTFTVAVDTSSITTAVQDVINKFNEVVKVINDNSGRDGPLASDATVRTTLNRVRSELGAVPSGLPSTNAYQTTADLGLKTNRDGTLSLNTTTLTDALKADPTAAKKVFAPAGTSTNAILKFNGLGKDTTTGALSFTISSYDSGTGDVTGTINSVAVTGTGSVLLGPAGSSIDGLSVTISGTGSGTLTVSRGVGQAVQDLVTLLTNGATGDLPKTISGINDQNVTLNRQITDSQARLDRRKQVLQLQFAQLEATIGQLQAAGQSLAGIR